MIETRDQLNGPGGAEPFTATGAIIRNSPPYQWYHQVRLQSDELPTSPTDSRVQSIPAFLLGKLQSQLKLQQSISVQDVTAIVKAIDHNGPTLCSRLDSTAYGITCSILRLSVDCLAYYRGLCLITVGFLMSCCRRRSDHMKESLHGTASSSPQQQALMSQRKSELGGVALTWLLRNFVKIERSDQARRWVRQSAVTNSHELIYSIYRRWVP